MTLGSLGPFGEGGQLQHEHESLGHLGEVEKHITKELFKQIEVKPKSVECPKAVKEKQGESFECTAAAFDGSTAKILVEMKGEGTINWKVVAVTKALAPGLLNGFE